MKDRSERQGFNGVPRCHFSAEVVGKGSRGNAEETFEYQRARTDGLELTTADRNVTFQRLPKKLVHVQSNHI